MNPDTPVYLETRSETGSRTARTAAQTTFAAALVSVGLWVAGIDAPAEVVAGLVVIVSSVTAFVQNVWEATIGRRLFERPL